MSYKNDILRHRNTVATERRIDNFRRLLAELGSREMYFNEIMSLLQFSNSGTRKYITELREAHVIVFVRCDKGYPFVQRSTYRLSPNKEAVDAFLAIIHKPNCERYKKKVRDDLADGNKRTVHVMEDDAHFAVRLSKVTVRRDPLVEFLFGPAKVKP